jgi:iron-sulfur cluster assembly accessory protein
VSVATSVQIGTRPSPITLSERAIGKVTELLAEEEGSESLALRVAVRPGGCSGYSYDMFFDSEIADDDIVRTFGDIKVVIDPESAELVKGATLDYRDGLQGAGFHITNPNATRTCGCGSSFS